MFFEGSNQLSLVLIGAIPILGLVLFTYAYFTSKLRSIPGPTFYALTQHRLAWDAWKARSIHTVRDLHLRYGPVVRIGPDTISFNSLSALKTIYGAGSGFDRTSFYRMFDAYGRPNLFTFASGKDHRERKKLVSHIYSNQTILSTEMTTMVHNKVNDFLDMLKREPQEASEIFASLHYFSFDTISEFVYGRDHGGTNALIGSKADRCLIDDVLNPARRKLAWFAVHFPKYTKWITTRTGVVDEIVARLGLLPMPRPFTYSGIRNHALKSFYSFKGSNQTSSSEHTVIARLFEVREKYNLSDMDIASECADHLLAGIDTTADSLMFMIWALSLPKNLTHQEKLRSELSSLSTEPEKLPHPKDLARLPYLNSIVKESLRLYSPLPAFEPRVSTTPTIIDNYAIPAGTVVGMSPYCLHRDPDIFPDPLVFNPSRWLTPERSLVPESDIKNRYYWAFSSGARMCIGMHLANAEMLTLLAAVYMRYRTVAKDPEATPGITSRYEVFYDETMKQVKEHECRIDFQRLD